MPKKSKKQKKQKKPKKEPESTSRAHFQLALNAVFDPPFTKYKGATKKILVEQHFDGIFSVHRFLTPGECTNLIQLAESVGFEQTDQRETRESAHRRNGRLQVNSSSLAEKLWSRCCNMFPEHEDAAPVGLSDNFRFYKYNKGDRFGMHVDDSVLHGDLVSTRYTLLLYLNGDELEGGATNFYTGKHSKKLKLVVQVKPAEGLALAHQHFPSCLLHEGSAVTSGVKYLLRTDVLYRALVE